MKLENKIEKWRNELKDLDSFDQFELLLKYASHLNINENIQCEKYHIPGCKIDLWVKCKQKNNANVLIECDSDSLVIQGVLYIIKDIYEFESLEEIRKFPLKWMDCICEQVVYEDIKKNGLEKLYKEISRGE